MAAAEVRSGGAVRRSAGKEKNERDISIKESREKCFGHDFLFPTVSVERT